jgi:hypothetical protein
MRSPYKSTWSHFPFLFAGTVLALSICPCLTSAAVGRITTAAQQSAPTAMPKPVGTIKNIAGNVITLASDSGVEISITVPDGARLLRVEPGQTDLKSATPVQLSDLQTGDRIFARGQFGPDAKSLTASVVILMKKTDIEQKHETEREQWQHGFGGIVSSVDTAAGTITISAGGFAGARTITVHTTKATDVRRYAPNSVKFDDAKPSSIDQIKTGDQLRTRGAKSADGTSIEADAIVSGTFRSIAGTISSVDANANSVTVADLVTKETVTVNFTGDSQLRQLPDTVAERIAMRLKASAAGGGAPGAQGGNAQPGAPGNGAQQNAGAAPSNGGQGMGAAVGRGANGPPDFQQILSRMPAATLADLQKGKAVMIVATRGADAHAVTAITLVSGVEPILQAAPKGTQAAALLSPWNIGGAPAGAGGDTP